MHGGNAHSRTLDPGDTFWALARFAAAHATYPHRAYQSLLEQWVSTFPNATDAELLKAQDELQQLLGVGEAPVAQ